MTVHASLVENAAVCRDIVCCNDHPSQVGQRHGSFTKTTFTSVYSESATCGGADHPGSVSSGRMRHPSFGIRTRKESLNNLVRASQCSRGKTSGNSFTGPKSLPVLDIYLRNDPNARLFRLPPDTEIPPGCIGLLDQDKGRLAGARGNSYDI